MAIAVYTVLVGAEPPAVRAVIMGSLSAVTRPELAVIAVRADNRFGHPTAETLTELGGAGVQVLRTDQVGTVEFVADGERYWVRQGSSR